MLPTARTHFTGGLTKSIRPKCPGLYMQKSSHAVHVSVAELPRPLLGDGHCRARSREPEEEGCGSGVGLEAVWFGVACSWGMPPQTCMYCALRPSACIRGNRAAVSSPAGALRDAPCTARRQFNRDISADVDDGLFSRLRVHWPSSRFKP
eukprot:365443-Chlamydomonas_euryale.AAC.8